MASKQLIHSACQHFNVKRQEPPKGWNRSQLLTLYHGLSVVLQDQDIATKYGVKELLNFVETRDSANVG